MNAGLGSLKVLKRYLLAEALRSGNDYDEKIKSLGLGVAAAMDRFCSRRLARAAGDTVVFSADRDQFCLPRYPVEAITTVEQKDSDTAGWLAVSSAIINSDFTSGMVWFGHTLGPRNSLVRVTFTGGYWFDETEDDTGVMPAAATPLPKDLQLAWLMQCERIWKSTDKLGLEIVQMKPSETSQAIGEVEFIPQVKTMLAAHIRYQIT